MVEYNNDGWAPTELLAKLTAHGIQLDTAPGGKPKITAQDVAAALTGLEYGPHMLARVKYCGDRFSLNMFRKEVRRRVFVIAWREKWKKTEYVEAMAIMAANDAIDDSRCKKCKGTCHDKDHKKCLRCDGTGREEHVSHVDSAERCHPKMTPDAWRMTWASRYGMIMNEIKEWDNQIGEVLRQQLKLGNS